MFLSVALCKAEEIGPLITTVGMLAAMMVVIHQFALGLQQPVR